MLLALELVALAVVWRPFLQRRFVWVEPAVLTWADFSEFDRTYVVGSRMWRSWFIRLVTVGTVSAVAPLSIAATSSEWSAAVALMASSAAVTLGLARRAALSQWLATAWACALAVGGLLLTIGAPTPPALYLVCGVGVLLAVLAWRGTGALTRPSVAYVSRGVLIDNWRERVVQSVGISFLDPSMLLPVARESGNVSLGRPVLLRLAWAGVLGRRRFLEPAVLLGIAAAVAHAALAGVSDVLIVACLGYIALIPFAGGLSELWLSPGRRRWISATNSAIRISHAAILAMCCLGWGALFGLGCLLLGAHPSVRCLWIIPILAASLVRTAARPHTDYSIIGTADTPFGQLPAGLAAQALRGLDVFLLGTGLVIAAPFGLWTWVVTGLMVLYGVLR
jgi:hypothetical protein